MKNKLHQNGPGIQEIDRLVKFMVSQTQTKDLCKKMPGGLRVSISDKPKSVFINYEWITRLKWVEKQSAIFLLHAPIVYNLKQKTTSEHSTTTKKIIRLSFALSLSIGLPCYKRYTVIFVHGERSAKLMKDISIPHSYNSEMLHLEKFPKWALNDIPKLIKEISKAFDHFKMSEEVKSHLLLLGKKRKVEFDNLEELYPLKKGSYNKILGLSVLENHSSVETEVQRLQRIIMLRYSVEIQFRILSLGSIEAKIT